MAAATFTAEVDWARDGARFTDGRYGRGHRWRFDGGVEIAASSAPSSVPLPFSVEAAVDPEEAYVAALSSCHMLFFLHLAAKRGYVVDGYRDRPLGTMAPDEQGRPVMSTLVLRPEITFSGEARPTSAELDALHHAAHEACYLANSVKTAITVAPQSR